MDPVISPSNGSTPFALIFDHQGHILVVEVNGGNGAVTSYLIGPEGGLDVISPSVLSGQVAACWIVGKSRGSVYTTNPGSASISSYIESSGGLVALSDATAAIGITTLDAGISNNGNFLYALDPIAGGIQAYRIEADGGLMPLGLFENDGLGIPSQGLAVK